jgi:hypothetical protein
MPFNTVQQIGVSRGPGFFLIVPDSDPELRGGQEYWFHLVAEKPFENHKAGKILSGNHLPVAYGKKKRCWNMYHISRIIPAIPR